MAHINDRVGVGVAAIVERDGKFLLGRRITPGVEGNGEWAFPGGKTDPGEDPIDAVVRELKEETGLTFVEALPLRFWNYDRWDDRHAVTLYFMVIVEEGEPQNMEPEKCEGWEWFAQENFPEPVFSATEAVRWLIA